MMAPLLADFATKFGPPEMFSIYLLAFILLSSLGHDFFTTMPMVLLGLMLASIGMDPLTGVLRFTHGVKHLYDGLGFVPVAMGAFGIGEILSATQESAESREVQKVRLRDLLPTREEFRASIGPIWRGTGIGFFVGPAARVGPHRVQLPLLPGGEAHLQASGGVRQRGHRGGGRARDGQQCGQQRGHDSVPRAWGFPRGRRRR